VQPQTDKKSESEELVAENLRLHEELRRLAAQLSKEEGRIKQPGPTQGESYSAPKISEDFYKQLQQELAKPSSSSTKEVLKEAVEEKPSPPKLTLPECIESPTKRAVLVCVQGKDEEEEDEVCVMDLTNTEWWTIVDSEKDREALRKESETYVACELTSGSTADDDDSYLLVDDRDLGEAFSNFVAQSIAKQYPEAKVLSPKQLSTLMERTFGELREPSKLGKVVRWGKMAYSTYGWACCAINLYRDPTMVKLIASGAMKACSWALFLLF